MTSKLAAAGAKDVDTTALKPTIAGHLQKAAPQLPEGLGNPGDRSKHATPGPDGIFKRPPGHSITAASEKVSAEPSSSSASSPPSSASKSAFGVASRTTPIPPSPFSSTHTPQTSAFPLSTRPLHPHASGDTGGKKLLAKAPPGSTLALERERRQSFRKSEPYVLPNVGLVVPPSKSPGFNIRTTENKTLEGKD